MNHMFLLDLGQGLYVYDRYRLYNFLPYVKICPFFSLILRLSRPLLNSNLGVVWTFGKLVESTFESWWTGSDMVRTFKDMSMLALVG